MSITEQLRTIRTKIDQVATAFGRDARSVALVAVSKQQPPERIHEALNAGLRVFGENRVQEASARWTPLRALYPDLCLHLIGPLQTNKVKEAVALFDVIETLDREKLALALKEEMTKQNRFLPCYIQVNTGDEPQKAGISIAGLKDFYDYCINRCGLEVQGLMCIPPAEDPPALHFALLRQYAQEFELTKLSMGMSDDFEKAIALGATSVRIGSALFGARMGKVA